MLQGGMLPGTVADAFVEPGRVPRLLAGFPALRHRNFRLFVVGPARAGALVAALGGAPCFLLNAASYVAVLVALARMRLPPSQRPRPAQALGAGFLSGLRYVWGAPALRNLLLLLGVVSGLGVQYNLLMPVFARTVLDTNAFGFGLLHTAGGVGAIAAALQLAARRYSRAQHRRHLLLGLVTFALAVLGLGASRP